ncbi:MAG: flagellar biosynthesis regulator FlaF [Deltaproteobacteria bacterium]|nr:flagellar biosynthesis regulator FlaF [Deltaproteobacteria bacterium]
MSAKQIEAYTAVQKMNMSGREIEASALTRTAMILEECRDNWDAPGQEQILSAALRRNQVLWSIFQAELTDPDNPLPKELKENILSLSLFIDKRTLEIMAFPSPEKLSAIININLNLAAGLRGEP